MSLRAVYLGCAWAILLIAAVGLLAPRMPHAAGDYERRQTEAMERMAGALERLAECRR